MTKSNNIDDNKLVIYRGYSLRLFPTKEQEKQLLWFCHAARRVWNLAIGINKNAFKYKMNRFKRSKLCKIITTLKAFKPEDKRNYERFGWLNSIPRRLIEVVLDNVENAYESAFNKTSGWPKFKSRKRDKLSFELTYLGAFQRVPNMIFITKIKNIAFKGMHKDLRQYKLIHPTVCLIDRGNKHKWILKYSLKHIVHHKPVLRKHSMGIDLNVKNLAVTSSGKQVRFYKNINKTKRMKRLEIGLKNLHRRLDRRKKDSKNWEKVRKRLNGKYYKMACIREDYTHKVTTKIVKSKPKCIVLEHLNVSGMVKNRRLAKSILEQGFYRFRVYITYKAQNLGIKVQLADRFFPSSKKCSRCGNKKHDLSLNDRTYVCDKCGLVIDRDLNAAKNLEKLSA